MSNVPNPFHPSFGVSPPLLVGRDHVIADFREALLEGPGATGRATLYTGARGSGKTVVLNAVEDLARAEGWLVVSETATPGFVERMTRAHLPRLLSDFDPAAIKRRITGFSAPMGAGGLSWATIETHVQTVGLRQQIELLTDLLSEHGTGLLLTLDEIHRHQLTELRDLATTVQHAFREGRDLAFAGAGLAAGVSDIMNDEVLTFLRRADRHALVPVRRSDVERGFREPIEAAGRSVDPEALEVMVSGASGYPFLLQLVGAHTWRVRPQESTITVSDASLGVANARRRLATLVHEPALRAASGVDRAFLLAMALDDGPSRIADIQERMDVDANYASQYRLRLIAAELIESTGRGYVDFALPYLREHLRDQAAMGE